MSGDDSDLGNDSLQSDSSLTSDGESNSDSESDSEPCPTWSSNTYGLKDIPFTGNNTLLGPVPGQNKPIDWFLLLIDDIFLEKICQFSNAYAMSVFCGPNTEPGSRINRFTDITVPELRVFIGLLLHMGSIRLNRYQDYWKTDRLYNIPLFRQHMSRDRFLIILRCLHFCKPDSESTPIEKTNRLRKVQFLVDHFNNKMMSIYYPSKELSLDEGMILWRGRLQFRQYIKGKRHKYGIKLYVLSEPEGLSLRFIIYSGKNDLLGGKGHA